MKAKVEILGMFIIFDFMKLLTKTKLKVQILFRKMSCERFEHVLV